MLWIALHLPGLSLESFAATLDPALAGRPLALVEQHRIVQADAAARSLGVQPGMRRATAEALASALLLGQADARRDAQALAAVANVALAFTPTVAVSGGGVRLEVQSCLRCFGGLPALLRRLKAALAPLGHRLQLSSAPTAQGAALLARWRSDLEAGPHSTRLAALHELLERVPVMLLDPAREHGQALQGMGLHTLADLRALPRSGLARRFGPELLLALDRARGEVPEVHAWVELPSCFADRVELFSRAETHEQLMAGARVLLARLVAWAQARQGRIARFALQLHHEPRRRPDSGHCTTLEIALAEPAADPAHLLALLGERLARLPLPAPALELGLRCDHLVACEAPNGELFPSRASERTGLTRLIERLQARLGRDRVCVLEAVADHRPEFATRADPAHAAPARRAAGRSDDPGIPSSGAGDGPAPVADGLPPQLTRPVWLCPEPQPLHERGLHPLLDGRPLQLLAGPERIEAGWWDGALAARDYFIAATGEGALVWVYRARLPLAGSEAGGGWFLHGRFA